MHFASARIEFDHDRALAELADLTAAAARAGHTLIGRRRRKGDDDAAGDTAGGPVTLGTG